MQVITQSDPPEGSFIAPFVTREMYYTDAFRISVKGDVTLGAFIEAFYTTPLFRAERLVLRIAARRPSTDADVAALASGAATNFAAWTVAERNDTQILLADMSGRTKSWLHVTRGKTGTDLWFGSVVVPVDVRGKLTLGPVFQTLLGVHKLYSRLLLKAAVGRLKRVKAR